MDLTLRFSTRNCNIMYQDKPFASIKRHGLLFQKAAAACGQYSWQIKEVGFWKTVIQTSDTNNRQILGVADKSYAQQSNSEDILVKTFDTTSGVFRLLMKAGTHYIYVWEDDSGKEIIRYNLSELKRLPGNFSNESTATIDDSPSKEHLTLLVSGVFIIMLHIGLLIGQG